MTSGVTPSFQEWQVPSADAPENRKLGWLDEACAEGEAHNKCQRGYKDELRALEIISGEADAEKRPVYRSNVSSGRLKTNIRTTISGLSNIRPIWGFHSDNQAFAKNADQLNRVSRALYLEGFWDQSIKEALQWASATRTGWVRPVYRRNQAGWGRGDIELDTFGSPCVLPVQLPSNGDYQKAYAVTLMDEMPVYMAHSMFPDYQDRLQPTSSKYWYSSDIRKSAKNNGRKRWWNPFKRDKEPNRADMFIPVRYTTVIDLSINLTGQTIPMGQVDSPWYYEVPPLDLDGKITGKRNTANDARMYPYRRQIISSENCVMYDGPCFNWHGQLDLIPFCLDKWAWEPLGFGLVHDGYCLQMAIDEIDRGNQDKIRAGLDPALAYAMDAVGKREAEQFDPMQPRSRIAYDAGLTDKPFTSPVDPEVYKVSPDSLKQKELLEAAMDYQFQTRDIVELGKARALGKGMDQLEALMSANGPIVKDMARSIEKSLAMVGQQLKYLIPQYLTSGRVMQMIGEDQVTPETFDFDPAKLVPSHMPGENPFSPDGTTPVASGTPSHKRARWFAENVRFFVMPHSIHEITQMTHRLTLIQLRQRGAPIPWSMVMESCDVPNVEKPKGSTIQEQFYNEKETELFHMARLQQMLQAMGIQPPGEQGKHGGRPPSAQQAPKMKTKGDGRPVISESG